MQNVLTLEINEKGRDFVVGDIHGNFSLLKRALKKINFNPKTDRIIVAGDLVDRGDNSLAAKEWLKKDYFYSVMGNHDAPFAFHDDIDLFHSDMHCFPLDLWFSKVKKDDFDELCNIFREKLYPAIEIKTKIGLVGVIHAEVPDYHTWGSLKDGLNNKDYSLFKKAMWNRDVAKFAIRNNENIDDFNNEFKIPDVKHVFHGHTIANKLNCQPYHISNRYYIDTCSYVNSEKTGISIFEITEPRKRILRLSN